MYPSAPKTLHRSSAHAKWRAAWLALVGPVADAQARLEQLPEPAVPIDDAVADVVAEVQAAGTSPSLEELAEMVFETMYPNAPSSLSGEYLVAYDYVLGVVKRMTDWLFGWMNGEDEPVVDDEKDKPVVDDEKDKPVVDDEKDKPVVDDEKELDFDRILELHRRWLEALPGGQRADLSGMDLYRMVDLSGQNLRGADLSGANLRGVGLISASLRGADLTDANLDSANLYGADLTEANLTGANLRRALMRRAFLGFANLEGANLEGANLEGATLDAKGYAIAQAAGAKLDGAKVV
jgi:hypothetical protein